MPNSVLSAINPLCLNEHARKPEEHESFCLWDISFTSWPLCIHCKMKMAIVSCSVTDLKASLGQSNIWCRNFLMQGAKLCAAGLRLSKCPQLGQFLSVYEKGFTLTVSYKNEINNCLSPKTGKSVWSGLACLQPNSSAPTAENQTAVSDTHTLDDLPVLSLFFHIMLILSEI